MPLTGKLKQVAGHKCPHCQTEYGEHSKKQFLRCLYTSDYNFYKLAEEHNMLIEEYKKIKEGKDGKEETGEKKDD